MLQFALHMYNYTNLFLQSNILTYHWDLESNPEKIMLS